MAESKEADAFLIVNLVLEHPDSGLQVQVAICLADLCCKDTTSQKMVGYGAGGRSCLLV